MSIQINYKNNGLKKPSGNLVVFVDQNFNISGLKKHFSDAEFFYTTNIEIFINK